MKTTFMPASHQEQRSGVLDLPGMIHNGGEPIHTKVEMFLQCDNGGEYKSEEFIRFCQQHDIRREYTAPHAPTELPYG